MTILINLYGMNCPVRMSWKTIQELAGAFDWMPEFDRPPEKPSWSWDTTWLLTEASTQGLARALYRAVRAIENNGLSEPLIELVKEEGVSRLREFADFLLAGALYGEEPVESGTHEID